MELNRGNSEPKTTSDPLIGESSCCSCLPGFRSNTVKSSWWHRIHSNHHHSEPRWWVRAFLKIKEWSEIAAGPRWKTFIRRFNRDRRCGRDHRPNFQYDPLSYTLSFEDEDKDDDDEAGFGGLRSFSTRYASVPAAFGKAPAVISVDAVK